MSVRPPMPTPRGPNLSNAAPATGLRMMPTAAAGSMTMPVTVADWPSTFWMKIGNVTLVAATAALIRVTRIAELRKLRVARVSTRNNGSSSLTCLYMNATKATRPTTIEIMTTGLVHPIVEADEKP